MAAIRSLAPGREIWYYEIGLIAGIRVTRSSCTPRRISASSNVLTVSGTLFTEQRLDLIAPGPDLSLLASSEQVKCERLASQGKLKGEIHEDT